MGKSITTNITFSKVRRGRNQGKKKVGELFLFQLEKKNSIKYKQQTSTNVFIATDSQFIKRFERKLN